MRPAECTILCVVALVAFVVLGDAVRREVSVTLVNKTSFAAGVHSSKTSKKKECTRVKGAAQREDFWGMFATDNCECPLGQVVDGSAQACKDKNNAFQRRFSNRHFADDGKCVCAPKAGCGMVRFPPRYVWPKNAEEADPKMIAPILVGNSSNIDTGIRELDESLYGIWWITKPLLYDVAFSFAGASSPFKGKNMSNAEVDWKNGVQVRWPNLKRSRWSWMTSTFKDLWVFKLPLMQRLVLPLYVKPDGHRENSIHFTNLTSGEVSTALKNMFFVWGKNWTIRQKNKDEWRVEIPFSDGSFFSDHNTTVKRIIDGNGQNTSYWKEYEDKTSEIGELVSFDSDSECKRRCMMEEDAECEDCHDCCFGNKGRPRWWCRHSWKRPSWTMF